MKKLLLAVVLSVFPIIGVMAQSSGDLLYLKDLKARAQSTQQRVTFEAIRSRHFTPYQYGKAGLNQMQKSNPGDIQLRYPGVKVGWCLKWSMCKQRALRAQGFQGIYSKQGDAKKIRMGTRVRRRDGRAVDRLAPHILDGERSGKTKLFYLFSRFF